MTGVQTCALPISNSSSILFVFFFVCFLFLFLFLLLSACACFLPGVNTSAHSALCDRDTGQCFCNSGVLGRTCDMCRNPSMKLGSASEVGCVGML